MEQTGKQLGKYTLKELIGRGGMADVYLGHQAALNRAVAIKIIHESLAKDDDFVTRFKHEAQAVAKMRHSNIVQVYDFDDQEGQYYLVLEYIEGGTLAQRLAKAREQGVRLPLEEVDEIIHGLCEAVDYAHRRDMLHRDIKPSNVMFHAHVPVLADFGVAKIMNTTSLTDTKALTGTPLYMSPEQAQNEHLDGRSDIYSLGVMLYEMTTGQIPFHADQAVSVLLKVISETPRKPRELNPELPLAVETVVLKAIEKRPEDRYQKAADLAHALSAALKPRRPETVQKSRAATSDFPAPEMSAPPPGSLRLKIMHGDLFETTEVFLNLEGSVRDAIAAILKDGRWPTTTSSGRPLTYRLYRRSAPGQPLPGGTHLKELALTEGEGLILERESRTELESLEALKRRATPPAPATVEDATEIFDFASVTSLLLAEDGRLFILSRGILNVGRADTVRGIPDIDLTRYDQENSVGRHHAQIVWQDSGYYVRDLRSLNHVFVNGTPIPPDTLQRLIPNAKVQFGDVVLTFQEIKRDA